MKTTIAFQILNQAQLLRRTLWALATRPPTEPFEVVVIDEGSTDDILAEMQMYSSRFAWKLLKLGEGEGKVLDHITGDVIIAQHPSVIAWGDTYKVLVETKEPGLRAASVYELPDEQVDWLGPFGSNLSGGLVAMCEKWPLQSRFMQMEDALLTSRRSDDDDYYLRFVEGAIGIHQGKFAKRQMSTVETVKEVISNV